MHTILLVTNQHTITTIFKFNWRIVYEPLRPRSCLHRIFHFIRLDVSSPALIQTYTSTFASSWSVHSIVVLPHSWFRSFSSQRKNDLVTQWRELEKTRENKTRWQKSKQKKWRDEMWKEGLRDKGRNGRKERVELSWVYYTILCYIILYFTILNYTMLYYTTSYHTILHNVIL